MNAFADTLLSLMFGWLRSMVEGIFSSASSGRFSSFFTWLGDHWFWLVAVLCIICLVLDYLIWFIRWRPYVIWRNKLRRLFGHRETPLPDAGFDTGYETGVDMDLTDMPDTPVPEYEYAVWQPELHPQPQEPVYEAPVSQPVYQDEVPYIPQEPIVRNRRSQRHEKKKFRLPGLLGSDQAEESGLIDGLPPVVNKEDAFHAPVYPDQYQNP